MKVYIFLITFFISISLFGANANKTKDTNETNISLIGNSTKEVNNTKEMELKKKREKEASKIDAKLLDIDKTLKKNIWYTKYNNHQIYLGIVNDLNDVKKRLKKINSEKDSEIFTEYTRQAKALENQLELLSDFKNPPFESLTKPEDLESPPKIDNPFNLFKGFTYLKIMKKRRENYKKSLSDVKYLIDKLTEKEQYARRLNEIFGGDYNSQRIDRLEKEIDDIIANYDISENTFKIYSKKIEDNILKTTSDIKVQVKRLFNIATIIFIILLLSFLFKYIAKKTISDNERYYMANKGINFINFLLIVLVLLFSFLENVSHIITVLGFVSAGLAFAMKDIFMSILGWIVIVFGGAFHVGDRIKVKKDGLVYVGDIVDISILRMTILEDITLTTYDVNRRSGRIIFLPNNYIFTDLLANYTHGKIKTVWDGVDFTVTFDSNYKKAAYLAKEIVKKYSKGYTDISRRQLNLLRSRYSLKNINVEPRVYTFIEDNGIKISCWYMTNSYATLTLRSNIFSNIMDSINENDDITLAYSTQTIELKKTKSKTPPISENIDKGEDEKGIF